MALSNSILCSEATEVTMIRYCLAAALLPLAACAQMPWNQQSLPGAKLEKEKEPEQEENATPSEIDATDVSTQEDQPA